MKPKIIVKNKACKHTRGFVIIVPFLFGIIKKHIFICRDCGFTARQKKNKTKKFATPLKEAA